MLELLTLLVADHCPNNSLSRPFLAAFFFFFPFENIRHKTTRGAKPKALCMPSRDKKNANLGQMCLGLRDRQTGITLAPAEVGDSPFSCVTCSRTLWQNVTLASCGQCTS